MCSRSPHSSLPKDKRAGFTLLEVMLAVLILGLISLSIYRFVETTLTAVRISQANERERELVRAFVSYLRGQLLTLPPTRMGAITGEPHRFNKISSDELTWVAKPGSALLTRHAEGEWTVTLTSKELKNGEYELGLRRLDVERKRDQVWLPIFRGVRGFEVRYYDAPRKQWLEKWVDPQSRPALVRVKLWRDPAPEAYEVVLPIPVMGEVGSALPPTNNPNNGGRGGRRPLAR